MRAARVLVVLSIALGLVACAGPTGRGIGWPGGEGSEGDAPRTASSGEIARGLASWYGEPHHGRRTANGEVFDMNALTAAHRTLPFGTRVRVENPATGQSVVVRINDRGPFTGGRIIDLSRAAAERIGLLRAGVAPVVIRAE